MGDQLTTNAEALRLFFTEDVFLVAGEAEQVADFKQVTITVKPPVPQAGNPSVQASAAPLAEVPVTEAAQAVDAPAVNPVHSTADVAVSTPAAVSTPSVPHSFKYLGKNQKNVLILVHDTENDVSTERGRELLRNLVKAIGLTANDFALLNYATHANPSFTDLHGFFGSRLLLSFGVSSGQLGLSNFPQHQLHMHGSAQVVFTGNLDLLSVDQEGKKVLWGNLKKITL